MSSRALRKIRGDQELAELANLITSSENNMNSNKKKKKKKKKEAVINVFDLLDQEEQSAEEVHQETEDIEEPTPVIPPQSQKRKKKKKKKGKPQVLDTVNNESDDIDEILQELNINITDQTGSDSLKESPTPHSTSLTVLRKNLNVEVELRRMFGREAVDTARNPQFRKRNYIFLSPKGNWPPMTKCGIQMVVDKTVNGITYFKYVHSKANYHKIQQMFWRASHFADPSAVQQVLGVHPYHVDTLLHLSEVCRVSEDTQTASDLLDRAIFCLEKALHPNFNVASVNCRLDYKRAENRALFIAIFRKILYVSLKSCFKTAFELTKLLFNLDPENDPLACLLLIDSLALKTEDFNFVLQFIDEFNHSLKLTMLPNFSYSYAIAQFYKEIVENSSHEKSNELLRSAVLNYPMMAQLICEKCSLIIESNPLYVTNETVLKTHSRSLTQMCKLYLERSSDLWKDLGVVPWLKQNIDYVNNNFSTIPGHREAESRRKSVFLSPPLNVIRHIFISDISAVSALLPQSAFETSQQPHDPMPPPNSYRDYQPETRQTYEGNPVLAFINSLMPGFTQNDATAGDVQGLQLGGLLHPAGDENQAGLWGQQVRNIPGDFGANFRAMLNNMFQQHNGEPMPEVADEAEDESEGDVHNPEDDLD